MKYHATSYTSKSILYRLSIFYTIFFCIDPAIDIEIFLRENVVRKQISTA